MEARRTSFGSLVGLGQLNRSLQNLPFAKMVAEDNGEKEEADMYRKNGAHSDQAVYTFERWNKHRQPVRYARHLVHMFNSRVFRSLLPPLAAVMFLSLFVGLYETLLKAGAFPGHWPHISLALGQAWNLTGFALSLLLAFRTNHSYDRWWEARKIWGGIVNRSRDIVRQGLVFFRPDDVALKEVLARWSMAFSKVLMCHLREDGDVQKELQGTLSPEELRALLASAHRPNFVIQMLAETIRQARLNPITRARMDDNLTFFEDAMGSCERILRTPIPLSYTRHTSRFLLVWLIMLPLTLWAAYSWASVFLVGIFGFLMLGIDEIGVQIEEPFGVLPLEAISGTIERNLRELMAMSYGVQSLVAALNPMGDAVAALPAVAEAEATTGTEEFGAMMGASPVEDAKGSGAGIALTSSASGAAAGAPQPLGSHLLGADGERGSMRLSADLAFTSRAPADLIEIELQSGGETRASPKIKNGRSTYAASSWLQD